MTQEEKRLYLIKELLTEFPQYSDIKTPSDAEAQKRLLRSLMNVRPPRPASDEFLNIQDEYLQAETAKKGITRIEELTPVQSGIYLWQGDITTLAADAIVNAANSALLGCFVPCHGCIDNAIHSAAGIQLRLECAGIMKKQGFEEPTGKAKITGAYNLPCRYVLHTVGPIVRGRLTDAHRRLLKSCYVSCLKHAREYGIKSLAFCCISTGEFHFPNREAAKIATDTVREFLNKDSNGMKVIFNVFKDEDMQIYRELLAADQKA